MNTTDLSFYCQLIRQLCHCNYYCKIEFYQPSCWLYSMSNLLVILAISNPGLRWKSCKSSVWENVKKCSRLCKETETRDWISRVARGLQATRSCTRAKHARSWRVITAGALQDKKYRLVVQLPRGWNLRLSQAASPSRQLALFWKT